MKRLTRFFARPGAPAGFTGTLIALQLILWRVVGSASADSVSLVGHELHWGCLFKQLFGIPCPTCGMTRSVLLTLHGHIGQAWTLNPAGTLMVFGTILFGAAMFLLMFYQQTQTPISVERVERKIRHGALTYAALLIVVLLGHWFYEIA
jgi:hypothetical protein